MNAALLMVCLSGAATVGQESEVVQKSPRIEVKTETRDGKAHSYVLYNRIYMGRQYHKSKDMPAVHLLPTTYFHDKSPIGVLLKDAARFPAKKEPPVAVLGMDVGTLAAYAKPGQTFHFTERVPIFAKMSLPEKDGKRYFTYVQDAIDRGAKLQVFEGEPRDMIEKHGKEKFYQIIVVESYKLPVVEVHKELMTKEALQMLMSKVRADGIVAFHTSNRYYNLAPIIVSAANELKLASIVGRHDGSRFRNQDEEFRYSSEWVMVARQEKFLPKVTEKRDADSVEPEWRRPEYERLVKGRLLSEKLETQFLWTDKGEQSFRGLYRSDPKVDAFHDLFYDLEEVARDKLGMPDIHRHARPIHDAIRAWSAASAERLNAPAKKDDKK